MGRKTKGSTIPVSQKGAAMERKTIPAGWDEAPEDSRALEGDGLWRRISGGTDAPLVILADEDVPLAAAPTDGLPVIPKEHSSRGISPKG